MEVRQIHVENEERDISIIAAEADADLQAALPALEMANEGLKNLNNQQLAEVRSLNKPPAGIDVVCAAIMIIMGKDPSWASVKKEMQDSNFLKKMEDVDKDHIS